MMSKESKGYDQRESRAKPRGKNMPKKVCIRTFGWALVRVPRNDIVGLLKGLNAK